MTPKRQYNPLAIWDAQFEEGLNPIRDIGVKPVGSKTEIICKAMKNQGRYRHLRVDWVGESSSESITLCGIEGEDTGTGQTLCPDCAQVSDALNVCGLGPESLRELFDALRVIGPSEVKAKMEVLRGLGVQLDRQDRSQLN